MARRITYYVYHGDRLVDIWQCYSAEGAVDWAAFNTGIPKDQLEALRTPKNALQGC